MKTQTILLLFLHLSLNALSQEITYDKKGKVKSVKFYQVDEKSKIYGNSQEFINAYLQVNENYEFKEKPGGFNHEQFKNETFQQYYKGIKVEDACFSFHYRNDTLIYANGNFIEIDAIDIVPNISPEEARDAFAQYKKIPIDLIKNYRGQ